MTTQTQVTESTNEVAETAMPDELTILKQRATLMGVKFSNNISVETLRAKIEAHVSEEETVGEAELNPLAGDVAGAVPASKMTMRQQLMAEQLRLVRLRITNLDPKKKDLPGEILTVGNEYIGTVRKFVPFGEVTDDGYHVPYILYKLLENRRFLHIRTVKDRRTGKDRIETQWAKEFALEVLPPLTEEELKRLANAQAAAGSLD